MDIFIAAATVPSQDRVYRPWLWFCYFYLGWRAGVRRAVVGGFFFWRRAPGIGAGALEAGPLHAKKAGFGSLAWARRTAVRDYRRLSQVTQARIPLSVGSYAPIAWNPSNLSTSV
jgi:hypothetical protein